MLRAKSPSEDMLNGTTQQCPESCTEVGGYFGLDIPDHGELYPDALKYQSARAATRAVLESNDIKHVLMPAYICSSIVKAAVDAGVAVETYDLDELCYPKALPSSLPDQCVLLYVNYFGLCQGNIARLLDTIPNQRLIIDNSQALFAARTEALASIYSPRKFVGLPDGGMLRASPFLRIAPPTEEDHGSFDRMRYLLVRMACSARDGYADFERARNSLQDSSPLAMSRLTQRLMKSIRWDQVSHRRRENYAAMAELIGAANEMPWTLGENDVPLCYPFTVRGSDAKTIRKELALRNVFTATYWLDALPRIKAGTIEATLINETLFLPIDQRLSSTQVEKLGKLVLALTRRSSRRNC